MVRRGASLLELVIAIVVMGIAVMALPLMLERVQRNNEFAMQQEGILAARTYIGDILTFPWDENSYDGDTVAVLDVAGGDNELDRIAGTPRRVGHIESDRRRKLFTANTPTTVPGALGQDAGDGDDLDDFDNTVNLVGAGAGDEALVGLDYKFDINMTIATSYVTDTADYSQQNMTGANAFIFVDDSIVPATSTNIKMLTLNIQGQGITPFTLRAYSSNIGGGEYLRRGDGEW